ncbi:MAG: PHP domain-containing protein, partial [Ferruginibacter sp.]
MNCKTYFSFRYGTFATEELVKTAVDKGIGSLAVTNINSTCDVWDFVKLCQEQGIKPIPGVEIRNNDQFLYILLAANNEGLKWLHEFVSTHLLEKKDFPENVERFFEHDQDGFVIFPLDKPLDTLSPNERIGVLPWEVNKLFAFDLKKYADKFVIRHPVTVQDKERHNLHRLLRCIQKNILLSKLPPEVQALESETFISPGELLEKFKHYPFIVTNTYKLVDSCKIEFDFSTDKNKRTFGGALEDDKILLEKL